MDIFCFKFSVLFFFNTKTNKEKSGDFRSLQICFKQKNWTGIAVVHFTRYGLKFNCMIMIIVMNSSLI